MSIEGSERSLKWSGGLKGWSEGQIMRSEGSIKWAGRSIKWAGGSIKQCSAFMYLAGSKHGISGLYKR
jgi:hypothetical protein